MVTSTTDLYKLIFTYVPYEAKYITNTRDRASMLRPTWPCWSSLWPWPWKPSSWPWMLWPWLHVCSFLCESLIVYHLHVTCKICRSVNLSKIQSCRAVFWVRSELFRKCVPKKCSILLIDIDRKTSHGPWSLYNDYRTVTDSWILNA